MVSMDQCGTTLPATFEIYPELLHAVDECVRTQHRGSGERWSAVASMAATHRWVGSSGRIDRLRRASHVMGIEMERTVRVRHLDELEEASLPGLR
jgi:hypothetical protein